MSIDLLMQLVDGLHGRQGHLGTAAQTPFFTVIMAILRLSVAIQTTSLASRVVSVVI